MLKKFFYFACGVLFIFIGLSIQVQSDFKYQMLPEEMVDIVDVPVTPGVIISPEAEMLAVLNDIFRGGYTWMPDSKSIIYKAVLESRGEMPQKPAVPVGSDVQESAGSGAAVRTYQYLLKTPYDEKLFTYLGSYQLFVVDMGVTDRARESVFHTLCEMDNWLEKYV